MSVSPSPACSGCVVLPPISPACARLVLAPPLGHTYGLLRGALTRFGLGIDESIPDILMCMLPPDDRRAVLTACAAALTANERAGTQALLIAADAPMGIANLMRACPLARLVAEAEGMWLRELLVDDRLIVHFQPIVPSAEPARVFAYECLSRGRLADGSLVYPAQIYPVATAAGLLFHLDRATRVRAIETAVTLPGTESIFINFSPSAIYTPAFCLRSTSQAARASGIDPQRIVFEVVESEEVRDIDHLLGILRVYREAGFRVALDDLGAGYGSLTLLHRLNPDIVKLDMGLVRDVDRDPVKATIAAKLLETAAALNIATVAEGVETEAEWTWLREHGATYQQGYLFARPAYPASVSGFAPSRMDALAGSINE